MYQAIAETIVLTRDDLSFIVMMTLKEAKNLLQEISCSNWYQNEENAPARLTLEKFIENNEFTENSPIFIKMNGCFPTDYDFGIPKHSNHMNGIRKPQPNKSKKYTLSCES